MATEIPYEFVIDLLYPLHVRTKKMFGVLSVYAGEKIVFALSQQQDD